MSKDDGLRRGRGRLGRRARIAAALGVVAAGAGATAASATGAQASKVTITLAYGSTYVFDTVPLTNKFYEGVATQFEHKYPNVTVKLVPIPGSYNDINTKLALLYRSPSTAPDVAELFTGQIGLWASSGYLRPLNQYLSSAPWWKHFPSVVQSEGNFSGKVYAVSQGENDSALFYNKQMFAKAGLPVPWHPHTAADIISAAEKIHKAMPNVSPLWLNVGTASGANGLLQGINNILVGTPTPTIYDKKTGKWVVDSPGIRDALQFTKDVYGKGLGAPLSDVFNPNAVTEPLTLFAKGQLAIAVGSNYYEGNWTKFINAPYWKQASSVMGVTPIPTWNGAGHDVASTLGGLDYAVAAHSQQPKYAFDLISLMEQETNSIDAVNWAGWVPPDTQYANSPAYKDFAPYNQLFAQIEPNATLTPSGANYTVWAQAMGLATGALAQHPSTSVAQAEQTLKNYATQQIGSSSVETLK